MEEYSKEQLRKLYENLPKDLQDAVFSEQSADIISSACEKSGASGPDDSAKTAKIIGHILLGILPPNELPQSLEKELNIKAEVAEKIYQEIGRLIFLPLKNSLEALYNIKLDETLLKNSPGQEQEGQAPRQQERGNDDYREPIE
jgi:hypothetical protein